MTDSNCAFTDCQYCGSTHRDTHMPNCGRPRPLSRPELIDTADGLEDGCPMTVEGGKRAIATIVAKDAQIAALREAAKLTILHFNRNQASGNFQGDDEHECWAALEAALAADPGDK